MKLIDDDELREKIRRKCLNDWDIELNEDQITMGIIEQEEQKLSIFHNQLWPNKRSYKDKADGYKWKTRVTWDKTIDGYRTIALRNGFAGIDPTQFVEVDGKPSVAMVTVYKVQSDGNRYPFVGEARFDEFAPRDKDGAINLTGQWKTAPYNQLSIAAQRQALRLAFQECNDGQAELYAAADTATETPEPDLEPSRGQPSPTPGPTSTPEPAPEPEKPKGKFVGIPKDGFKFGQMYNEKERIVLKSTIATTADSNPGAHKIGLDSGKLVHVNPEGFEVERNDRTDDSPGGRPWKVGKKYYGGEVIEGVAPAKKNPKSLWLALDSGMKVKVDQWGKEVKRKERKKKEEAAPKEEAKTESPKGNSLMPTGEYRKLSTLEEMRKHLIPALAQWCRDVNGGKKISPKTAHTQLNGVTFDHGQSMSIDDFPVLYECLIEALEAQPEGGGGT